MYSYYNNKIISINPYKLTLLNQMYILSYFFQRENTCQYMYWYGESNGELSQKYRL